MSAQYVCVVHGLMSIHVYLSFDGSRLYCVESHAILAPFCSQRPGKIEIAKTLNPDSGPLFEAPHNYIARQTEGLYRARQAGGSTEPQRLEAPQSQTDWRLHRARQTGGSTEPDRLEAPQS